MLLCSEKLINLFFTLIRKTGHFFVRSDPKSSTGQTRQKPDTWQPYSVCNLLLERMHLFHNALHFLPIFFKFLNYFDFNDVWEEEM
jgi:hypothetical protein